MTSRLAWLSWPLDMAAVLAVASVGCRASVTPGPRQVTLAVRADVTGFFPNPPVVNEGYTQDINWNLFEGLSGFDGRYHLVD